MVGGMVSATLLTLIVFPAIYAIVKEIQLRHSMKRPEGNMAGGVGSRDEAE